MAWGRRTAVVPTTLFPSVAATAAACLLLSGCGPDAVQSQPSTSSTTTKAAPAVLTVSVPDGAKDVDPSLPITVKATSGTLEAVKVATTGSEPVSLQGIFGTDGNWSSLAALKLAETYQVTASARSASGETTELTSTFTTLTPKKTLEYTVTPDGQTVGAGMPLTLSFKSEEGPSVAARAAIESRLVVTTVPHQEGAWSWIDKTTLEYRPKSYWAAGTKITVQAPLSGIQAAPDTWIDTDNGAVLTIGTQRVMKVNLATHRMDLMEDGALVRTFLISGGRPGINWETRNGIKVITEKNATMIMDSSTFGINKGDPNYYRTPVDWAMRITNSGEFLHSAPWSVGEQGYANVSHGCINMAPGDAQWLFNRASIGDVVETTGGNYALDPGDGITAWNVAWDKWLAGSAVKSPAAAPPAKAMPTASPTLTPKPSATS